MRVLCAHNDDDIWFPMVFAEDEDSEEDEGDEGSEEEAEARVVSEGAPPMPTGDTGLHDMYDTSRLWSFAVSFTCAAAITNALHA